MYDSELNGEPVTFGTSGFLYQNNKLMYDRTTNTLWHSLTGEPVVGELVGSGIELDRRPVTVTSWGEWLQEHPETTVVSVDTGFRRRYFDPSEEGSAYFEYRNSPDAMFPIFESDPRLLDKSNVVGIAIDGDALSVPTPLLTDQRVIHTEVGDENFVLLAHPDTGVLGVFESSADLRFAATDDPRTFTDRDRSEWTVTESRLVSDSGEILERVPAREMFWFAWSAFFPNTRVYSGN